MTKFHSNKTDNPIRDPLLRRYDEELSLPSHNRDEPCQTPWKTLYDQLDLTSLPLTILICANLTLFMYDSESNYLSLSLWVILLTQISLYFLLSIAYNYFSFKSGENFSVTCSTSPRTAVELWGPEILNLISAIVTFFLIWTSKDFNPDYNLNDKYLPINYLLKILFTLLITIEFISPCVNTENSNEDRSASVTSINLDLGTSICFKKLLSRIFFRFLILICIFIYTFYIIAHSKNVKSYSDIQEIHFVPPLALALIILSTVLKLFNKTTGIYGLLHYFFILLLFVFYSKKTFDNYLE